MNVETKSELFDRGGKLLSSFCEKMRYDSLRKEQH